MENKFYDQFKLKMEADIEQLIALYFGLFTGSNFIDETVNKYKR